MDEINYNRDELKKITFPRNLNYNLKVPRSKYFQIYPKRAIQNYLPAILNYYEMEIIDIQKGAWRGEGICNDFLHHQDVIISRKL